jgi:hypothetical protein
MSLLEDQLSVLKSRINQFEDGNNYITEILERVGKQLDCKFLRAPSIFLPKYMFEIFALDVGTCLDAAAADLRVNARIVVLKRVSAGTDTFQSDAQGHQAVVLL